MISATITIIFVLLFQITAILLCRKIKLAVNDMVIGGIICAITLVLASIMIPLPTGSLITCGSMLPILVLSFVYDYRLAIICGWICGILALILVPAWQPVHWAQPFIEHLICFSCLGFAGLIGSDKKWKILCGSSVAILINFSAHVLSGVIFFSENAWDGWGTWWYSIAYNGSSKLPETIFTLILISLLPINSLKRVAKGIKK